MNQGMVWLLVAPALGLLACLIVPSFWADRVVGYFRRGVTWLLAAQTLIAAVGVGRIWVGQEDAVVATLIQFGDASLLSLSLYYDGVASLMFLLVSFVGWVVCHFSIRYLAGQAHQGRYFRWTAVTVGAVSLMVISGNAAQFVGCWIMTSLGLHQLLVYYPQRPEAVRTARTKFAISRVGDLFLLVALGATYARFGTWEFATLFEQAQQLREQGFGSDPQVALIGWVLVMGAAIKSAQFPFHTWLPNSIETPTPVSALMHAGVVNAGGFLVIRWSPLITLTPAALALLAIIGTVTACLASLVMLTQTSQKRMLAYSTIAQMGFMLLQCGLGAFSAAMLHLVAHSLYKAYAFLNNGSVLEQRFSLAPLPVRSLTRLQGIAQVAGVALLIAAAYTAAMALWGINPLTKPGGFALGLVFCLAMTLWISRVLVTRDRKLQSAALAASMGLAFVYAASFWAIDRLVSTNPVITSTPVYAWQLLALVAVGFGGLFGFQLLLSHQSGRRWLHALHVHLTNGLYIDAILKRVFTGVTTS